MKCKRIHFPYKGTYPQVLANLTKELEDKFGYPADYISVSFLVAFGAAIGNTTHIRYNKSFVENAVLYCILVGKPSKGKSAPLHYALKHLIERDKKNHATYLKEIKAYKEIEAKRKDEGEAESMELPILKLGMLNDSTLESTLQQLRNNPRGVLAYHDELNGLIASFNRYRSGNDLETYLTMWSHKPVTVTRKGAEPFQISSPFCSIIGGAQPDVFKQIFSGPNNGWADRWISSVLLDNDIPEWTDMEVDPELEEKVENAFQRLDDLPEIIGEDNCIIPNILDFTPTARQLMKDWRNGDLHRKRLMEDMNETFAGAHAKMDIMALRFSLILTMMYYAFDEGDGMAVDVRAVEGAIEIVEYFKNQIEIIHNLTYMEDVRLLMTKEQSSVYDALSNSSFKTSEGVKIAGSLGMSEWIFKRFLKNDKFFKKEGYGIHRKIFIEE